MEKHLTNRIFNRKQLSIASFSSFPVKCSPSSVTCQQRGALLLEILVVTAILGVILSLGSQMVFVSLKSNKTAGDRDVAVGLLNETIEAVRAIGDERWQTLYALLHNGTHYYPVSSGGKWMVSAGGSDETVVANGINYTRYFTIENVSRCNDATRTIASSTTCTPSNTNYSDDPSTQKIIVSVSWSGSEPITQTEYLLRWRNKVCPQTDWSGGANPGGSANCSSGTIYDSISPASSINTSGGSLILQ